MTTTADMARQQVAEGEAVLVAEFAKSLDAQLEAALAEGRHCDEQLRDVGARLVEARGQAGPLWEKRTAVDLAMRELEGFGGFADPNQLCGLAARRRIRAEAGGVERAAGGVAGGNLAAVEPHRLA